MLLLGATTSSSILREDSETEFLHEELDDEAFDDDDLVFLLKTMLTALFIMFAAHTHNHCTKGFLAGGNTHKESI